VSGSPSAAIRSASDLANPYSAGRVEAAGRGPWARSARALVLASAGAGIALASVTLGALAPGTAHAAAGDGTATATSVPTAPGSTAAEEEQLRERELRRQINHNKNLSEAERQRLVDESWARVRAPVATSSGPVRAHDRRRDEQRRADGEVQQDESGTGDGYLPGTSPRQDRSLPAPQPIRVPIPFPHYEDCNRFGDSDPLGSEPSRFTLQPIEPPPSFTVPTAYDFSAMR